MLTYEVSSLYLAYLNIKKKIRLFTIVLPVSIELFINIEIPKTLSQTTMTIKMELPSTDGILLTLLARIIPITTISEKTKNIKKFLELESLTTDKAQNTIHEV